LKIPLNLKSYPLLRCLFLYRRTPIRFWLSAGLFAFINFALAWQQSLIAKAIHEVETGVAIVRTATGLDASIAWHWLLVIVGVAFGRAVLLYFVGWLSLVIQQDLLGHLREKILVQVQLLDQAYHWEHGAGEIVTRTTRDADKLRDALISFWRQVVDTSFVVIAAMGFLFWYHPGLGIVPLVLTCAGFGILIRQTDHLVGLDRAVGKAFDAVNQDLTEGVNGVRVIKAFALEPVRIARFEYHVSSFVQQALGALSYSASRIPLPQFVVALGQVWVLGYGLHLVSLGELNLGELLAALLMVNTLVFRVEGVGRVMQIFADARSSAARIWDLLDAVPKIQSGEQTLGDGPVAVHFNQVTVLPPGGGNAVLRNCTFNIEADEIVALVGATGSGKSTLCSLLPRLAEVSTGQVLLASQGKPDAGNSTGTSSKAWLDVRHLQLDDLRHKVHVVPQEGFLFSETLAVNLRLASPNASDEQLRWAIAMASAEEVLAGLGEGLDTKIGDRGITLSGGQRQRICLARALLSHPSLLVLDDATSALDTVTERKVLNNIRSLHHNGGHATTVLIVASKLSTIMLADRVLLLSDGHIAAQGTHARLLETNAEYRELMGLNDGS